MKTKIRSSLLIVAFALAATSCSDDWGKMDPPAGNQVYPTLETVATYDFEAEEGLDPLVFNLVAYPDGQFPEVVTDDMVESSVLSMTDGYARIANPLNAVTCQDAASLTFWMKQVSDPVYDEDGELVEDKVKAQKLTCPLLHWENEDASSTLDFSANGWWKYKGAQGTWSENDPADYKTGYITPDEWHYCAITLRNTGYAIYIDGKKKADVTTDTDFSGAVQLMAQAPYIYLNYGADTHTRMIIDDITFYRNAITSKQFAAPKKGKIDFNAGDEGDKPIVFDPRKWIGVGLEDCSTPWWTPETFSPLVTLTGDGSVHFGFRNYNNGTTNNWCNWLVVCTNGKSFGEDGYSEYYVLRSDAYGWGNVYNGDNVSHDFNWDTFCAEMDGAWVDLTITRRGSTIDQKAVVTTSTGETRNYSFKADGITDSTIGFFLLCEGSYLEVDPQEVLVNGAVFQQGSYILGLEDCTTPWWTPDYFSPVVVYNQSIGSPLTFTFYNHNNGTTNNWCNWLLVCTNGKAFGEDGYSEHFVLRSDAYGWGNAYNGDNISHEFNWDTYCADMDGAYVRLFITYKDDTVSMTAKITKNDGSETGVPLGDYKFKATGISGEVGFFLLCEGSYLDLLSYGFAPFSSYAN